MCFTRHTRILLNVKLHRESNITVIWFIEIKGPIRALPVRSAEAPVASKFTILLPPHSWPTLTTVLWIIDQPSLQNFFCFPRGHLSRIMLCFPVSLFPGSLILHLDNTQGRHNLVSGRLPHPFPHFLPLIAEFSLVFSELVCRRRSSCCLPWAWFCQYLKMLTTLLTPLNILSLGCLNRKSRLTTRASSLTFILTSAQHGRPFNLFLRESLSFFAFHPPFKYLLSSNTIAGCLWRSWTRPTKSCSQFGQWSPFRLSICFCEHLPVTVFELCPLVFTRGLSKCKILFHTSCSSCLPRLE